jgi:putative membrane protein (TIGR04086 family)
MVKQKIVRFSDRSKGIFLSLGVFVAMLSIWTLITYYLSVSNEVISRVSYAIITSCLILCSIYHSFRSSGKGWLNGLIGGTLFLLIICCFGFLVIGANFNVVAYLRKVPLFMVISVIGGIIGINLK